MSLNRKHNGKIQNWTAQLPIANEGLSSLGYRGVSLLAGIVSPDFQVPVYILGICQLSLNALL